ncbi:unnamed protein product [Bursaphelenchus xylophilus]|uniref:(pine wood nematode) hypothetical protein n=1 Tax=Bursaphelenchus xylophilus TaxID=6326 RepID=A0A1I7RNJ8_BURXY|nr:unnamed protein product [Bursaphelenchus xylophilus]CAG9124096.1 unnamed protein product [Bursaphelenchus xylophilus]
MKSLLLIVLLLAINGTVNCVRLQSVGCKGQLLCGDKPAVGVKVALWDEDEGPDPDDKLKEGHTDSQGKFELVGNTHELTSIDPVCKVYHDCDDGIKPGQRKLKFRIPSQYVFGESVPKKIFNLGILNLETIFPKEERKLL